MKKLILITAALALIALGGIAHAVTIDYTVDGWGPMQNPGPVTPPTNAPWGINGYPGDTLQLDTHTGTLDIAPGSYVQKINTLLWTIDYTYGGTATDPTNWSDMSFNLIAGRNIYFNGVLAGSLSQTGLLEASWDNDYITFNNGATTSFIFQGYQIDITPLGFDKTSGSNFSGQNPWVQPQSNIMARFDVTSVPEPSSIIALLGGLGSLLVFRRRKA